ncbi:MAG: hypothetical protein HFACDABA_02467 [Anaerolineales bacterium]|nr:hypothetical protein [Anaerolineales bacterium]
MVSTTYDGDGRRVKSVVNGETILFAGPFGHYELKGNEVTKYYFAGASRIVVRKYIIVPQSSSLTYLAGDHLGSTSLALDASTGEVTQTRYKPWGEVRYTTPSKTLPTRYTFTGQYSYVSDDATDLGAAGFGLMFYNARWYDPTLGRFAQADTIVPGGVQGLDRYAYVSNNPIIYTDPSGHASHRNGYRSQIHAKKNELLPPPPADTNPATCTKDSWGNCVGTRQNWLDTLEHLYDVTVTNAGDFSDGQIWNLFNGVVKLAGSMGGALKFKENLGPVEVTGVHALKTSKGKIVNGLAGDGWVKLNLDSFSEWTVVHEFAHAWDIHQGYNLSKRFEQATGGYTWKAGRHYVECESGIQGPGCNAAGYFYGGVPAKGADYGFNRKEDFAESVATYVLGVNVSYIRAHFDLKLNPEFFITDANFVGSSRWIFVNDLMTGP